MKKKFLSHYLIHQFKLRGKIIQNEKKEKQQETIQKTNNKGKIRRCSWFCFNRSKNCWLNNTSMDDSETVDYNNNTSVRDLVPVKYEIKDEEDRLETIETRNHG